MISPVITIDGPTASGKGTIARQVARQLGFHYLDSGVLYRVIALADITQGAAPSEVDTLVRFARTLPMSLEEITADPAIRTEAVSERASIIAVHAPLRAALIERQRSLRTPPGLVAEGRDMGTVVFPDADLKVFLTASLALRVHRRYQQLVNRGFPVNISALRQDLLARDARDSGRPSAPLAPAADARALDTSDLRVDEVVETILAWFAARAANTGNGIKARC
jgi:CMP/dCMP kinase